MTQWPHVESDSRFLDPEAPFSAPPGYVPADRQAAFLFSSKTVTKYPDVSCNAVINEILIFKDKKFDL